jgi:hypothetical protein
MTIQQLAQQAIDVQDACNLSGVVHSFSRAMEVLWAEARANNHGTDWINTHPIVTLFIDKLSHLNGCQYDKGVIDTAYPAVYAIAKGDA